MSYSDDEFDDSYFETPYFSPPASPRSAYGESVDQAKRSVLVQLDMLSRDMRMRIANIQKLITSKLGSGADSKDIKTAVNDAIVSMANNNGTMSAAAKSVVSRLFDDARSAYSFGRSKSTRKSRKTKKSRKTSKSRKSKKSKRTTKRSRKATKSVKRRRSTKRK